MLANSFLAACIFATAAAAADDALNAYGGTGPDVLCVYTLSGSYATLQRILYYVLLAYGVLGRRQPWLVTGALVGSMSYGGAAALHSIILVAQSRSRFALDLDIYGVFAVTSTGVLLTAPLLAFSSTLRTVGREVQTIVVLWSLLMLLGAILSVCCIYAKETFVQAPTCLPPGGEEILSAVSVFPSPTDNCTYACFPEAHRLLRGSGDIIAWPNLTNTASAVAGVFLPTISAVLPPTFIYLIVYLVRRRRGKPYCGPSHTTTPPAIAKLELGWIWERFREWWSNRGSSTTIRRHRAQIPTSRRSKVQRLFQYYCIIVSFGAYVVNIILNEIRLHVLPVNEMPYEVGQWSPWVSVALVVVAQIINHFSGRKWGRMNMQDEEQSLDMRAFTGSTFRRQSTVKSTGWNEEAGIRARRSTAEDSITKRRNSF